MSSLFSLDGEILPVKGGSNHLWSPNDKLATSKVQEPCTDQHIKFSPPSSKEAYLRIRNKYQVALSVMDKIPGTQTKSIRMRRRQSFAISQMLNNVSVINSTPLKMDQVNADRLVETMKRSAVKRRSIVPRSCKKSRAQVLRRVSRNINDIFASHFGEGDDVDIHSDFLTGATPHQKTLREKEGKAVQLMERFDDDPLMNVLDDTPEPASRQSLVGLSSPTGVKQVAMSARKTSMGSTTPQSRRNSFCSPQPSKPSTGQRLSVSSSAVKLRDTDFVTTSSTRRTSLKPPVPSSTPTRVLASNRKSTISSNIKVAPFSSDPTSGATTPVRANATPAGRTPLTYYTAAASARRPTMSTPQTSTTPQRAKVPMTCSALKLQKQAAASTPLANARNAIHTQVQLSVEKLGAFLQSMKKNDATRGKQAALTVSKAREGSPAASHTAQKSHAARTLDYDEVAAPSTEPRTEPRTERSYVYEADDSAADLSGMLDDVLDINIEAMLQDYAASRDFTEDCEAVEMPPVDAILHESAPNFAVVEHIVTVNDAEEESDHACCEMDVTAQDGDVSTYPMDTTACSPDMSAMDVDSPYAAAMDTTAVCDYASDSSSSPQIVRVRYSAGNSSRRSLSNVRGRPSLGAIDCLAAASEDSTSPLIFTAPAIHTAAVVSARVDLNNCLKAATTPRSINKGPVRLLQSASKAVRSMTIMPRGLASPQSASRNHYTSDSDSDLNASLQSTGKKVIRHVHAAPNSKVRRKSLACATIAETIPTKNEHKAEISSAHTSELKISPRQTRSACKGANSAAKGPSLLSPPRRVRTPAASRQSPNRAITSSAQTPSSVNKKNELVEAVEVVVTEAVKILTPVVAEKSVKKSRKSTAKKNAPTTSVAENNQAENQIDEEKPIMTAEECVPTTVADVLSPVASTKKASTRKSALKVVASPAPYSPRPYSLRSATKVAVSEHRTAKTLFPEDPSEDTENIENSAPSNISLKAASTPLGKPARVNTARKSTTTAASAVAQTPAGGYTVAKARRTERNHALDALVGSCDELLSMISASVSDVN